MTKEKAELAELTKRIKYLENRDPSYKKAVDKLRRANIDLSKQLTECREVISVLLVNPEVGRERAIKLLGE